MNSAYDRVGSSTREIKQLEPALADRPHQDVANRLKKLLRAGTISQEEYEVQKMNAKDIYRNRKLSIEGTEAADGDDDQGMTFTTGINANML